MKVLGAEWKFGPRDVLSVGAGVLTGGIGLVGTAAKKYLVADDSKWIGRKGLVAAAVGVLTGGVGLLSFVLANPGQPGKDVRDARQNVVDGRY